MRTPQRLLIVVIIAGIAGALIWMYVIRPIQPAWLPAPRTITDYFPNTNGGASELINGATNKTVNGNDRNEPTPGRDVSFPLRLPDGFRISLFASGLENARVLALDPAGTLLVSSPATGKVLALPDENHDAIADRMVPVLEGLNRPHGLAFRGDTLYVAETNGVSRWTYNRSAYSVAGRDKLFDLPAGGGHSTRTIRFGKDGMLYTTVGSSCNVCRESDERRATMLVSDADGKDLRVFAAGLRNTVFFDIHPTTGELWGADMGRDWLGDNLPPEDVNIIRDGRHYGWPFCYGNRVHDDGFDPANSFDCRTTEPPLIEMQAHSAPLGIAFVPQTWPAFAGDLLISFHGSWNRSVPTGYRVVRYDLGGEKPAGPDDFLSGFLDDGASIGRPVDLLFSGDTLFISDDKAGAIYRVTQTST